MSRGSPITRGNDHDPSWLPDGESLVFASDRDRGAGRYDLYRYWLADGSVERLTTFFNGYAFMPNVSPDGGWVAFVATTFPFDGGYANQVHVLELATKQTWPFDVTAPGCWPNWSPDGQSIAHVSLLKKIRRRSRRFPRSAPIPSRFPASRRAGITIRTGLRIIACSPFPSVPNIIRARTGISRSSIRPAPCRCGGSRPATATIACRTGSRAKTESDPGPNRVRAQALARTLHIAIIKVS